MPARDDIDPVTMPIELLPNIVLVDVLPEARRFRYRVMGTAVARMLGTDWTGRSSSMKCRMSTKASSGNMRNPRSHANGR